MQLHVHIFHYCYVLRVRVLSVCLSLQLCGGDIEGIFHLKLIIHVLDTIVSQHNTSKSMVCFFPRKFVDHKIMLFLNQNVYFDLFIEVI